MQTPKVSHFFEHDYPGDVWSWTDLMRRQIERFQLLRYVDQPLETYRTPTLMLRDIIAPAAKHVRLLLRERGFSEDQITCGRFEGITWIDIDRNQFEQVMFNLLANSIKYCSSDPREFRVQIEGYASQDAYVIKFRDWFGYPRRDGRGDLRGRDSRT